jgi:hypothetical protein
MVGELHESYNNKLIIHDKSSRCHTWFRKSNSSPPRPLKPHFLQDTAEASKNLNGLHNSQATKDLADAHLKLSTRATDERRLYKNLSIYATELPPTPKAFREKYTRNSPNIFGEKARKNMFVVHQRQWTIRPAEDAILEQLRASDYPSQHTLSTKSDGVQKIKHTLNSQLQRKRNLKGSGLQT